MLGAVPVRGTGPVLGAALGSGGHALAGARGAATARCVGYGLVRRRGAGPVLGAVPVRGTGPVLGAGRRRRR